MNGICEATRMRLVRGALGWAAALLSACALQTQDPNAEGEVALAEQAIVNGTLVGLGRRGVIGFRNLDNEHICTGVLIGERTALTSAHCTDQANKHTDTGTMHRSVIYYDPIFGAR